MPYDETDTIEPIAPQRRAFNQHVLLLAVLGLEITLFSISGTNFFRLENGLEVVRSSVEIGLLALALTPVIVSGGIDLSVGALVGLCAVTFGKLWLDPKLHATLGFEPGLVGAIVGALAVGAAAGLLNGWFITRLRIPPLIVTLGSMSLFRGLAEGITGGVENYTIPVRHPFLLLGNGYIFGSIPAQLPLFLAAIAGFWILLHRSIVGRSLVAIGFSTDAARYAGLPVERRLRLVYLLSGLMAGISAIVYVAHLGQAKSDAGTGYELLAITAVVLGGTSIFGGRGTILGTVAGLLAIAVLNKGVQLSDLPSELAGILTGVLLLATIALNSVNWRRGVSGRGWTAGKPRLSATDEEWSVKNSQVAALAAVILLAAIIVAASNWWLVHSLQTDRTGAGTPAVTSGKSAVNSPSATDPAPSDPPKTKPLTVAMMPKSLGNAYFIACRAGADEAATELGVKLLWDGPREPDPAKQNEIVETWITHRVDVIAVAVENREGISTALRRARERGIKVVTWDSDAAADARDVFVNQATPEGIGTTLMDAAARVLHGEGEFAIITASLTAANMIEWQKCIEQRRKEKYPNIQMAVLRPCDDKQDKAKEEATAILNAYPKVKLIMAICSPAVPGAAEAVRQSPRAGEVKVIGLGLPNDNKAYVHQGITESVVLWNTKDLGYLTVLASAAVKNGTLKPGDKSFPAGRLGNKDVRGDNLILGVPFIFNKDNIDRFDF
jgi:ribose/xylose/arabinose/galactoside ABC-type transport system permease subunit/ABC-type sugar transport system substrate-binding protein